jgi:hypothetical protein
MSRPAEATTRRREGEAIRYPARSRWSWAPPRRARTRTVRRPARSTRPPAPTIPGSAQSLLRRVPTNPGPGERPSAGDRASRRSRKGEDRGRRPPRARRARRAAASIAVDVAPEEALPGRATAKPAVADWRTAAQPLAVRISTRAAPTLGSAIAEATSPRAARLYLVRVKTGGPTPPVGPRLVFPRPSANLDLPRRPHHSLQEVRRAESDFGLM